MAKNTKKDSEMAKRLRAEGVIRTICRCPNCYKIVACESIKSRFTHKCRV